MIKIDDGGSLIAFINKSRVNRIFLISALVCIAVLLSGFIKLYPYPNLVLDSYYYIKAAVLNLSINVWPIGYSKFLQAANFFSHSPYFIVCVQYIFLEISCIFFFFTWRYFFKPGYFISCLVFAFLFVNPLFLYCANYILADSLFVTLSVVWFTQLLWIIYAPKWYMIVTHAILLIVVFTVRYNALYYPLIGILAFWYSTYQRWVKLLAISLPLVGIVGFIWFTSFEAGTVTGKRQFSAFGGWKLANDALYGYAFVKPDKIKPVPDKYKDLDARVRQYLGSKKTHFNLLENDSASGSFYMFQSQSPLLKYMDSLYGNERPFLGTRKWMKVAPLYQEYGAYLVRAYPNEFLRKFIAPNLIRYAFPPNEIFGSTSPFFFFETFGGEYIRSYFGPIKMSTKQSSIDLSIKISSYFSLIFTIIHFCFVIGILSFIFGGMIYKKGKVYFPFLLLVFALWLIDFCFSILSAGIVLRYEMFLIIIELTFGLSFIEYAYKNID